MGTLHFSINVCFGKQTLRCTRSEQYLQSSKVVPGEERARRLRSSSLSRVTCLSWNRTVSIFSFTWWLSMWVGGGEEAWQGVPEWVSMSLVACAVHKAQMMGEISETPIDLVKTLTQADILKTVTEMCSRRTLVHVLFSTFYWKLANKKNKMKRWTKG